MSLAAAPHHAVRRIFGGMLLILGGKAGAGLISIAYLLIAARALGPRDYGVLVLLHAYVIAVGGIVAFPAWQAIVRYGAEAREESAPHRLAQLLKFGTQIEAVSGTAAILVAACLAPLIGPKLGWPPGVQLFALPYSFAILGSVRSTPLGYLQLCNRFDLIGLHNLVAPVVRLGGAFIAWLCGLGLQGFIVAWLLAALAEWATLWMAGLWLAHRELGRLSPGGPTGRVVDENPGIWRYLVASNADLTLGELAGRVAPLVVGWMMGPAAAGLFAVAQRATVLISQPAQILGNAAYAELSRLVASGGGGLPLRMALARIISLATVAVLPIVILVALFPSTIIRLLAGEGFAAAGIVMIWLVVARAVAVAGPPCSAALAALGRPGLSMTANLVASLIFLPALPFFLQACGLVGAGIQAILQALLASGLLLTLTWRHSLGIR